jgi:glycerophosphoryl diester phosphodiesterase
MERMGYNRSIVKTLSLLGFLFFFISACERKYEAPVPDNDWPLFDTADPLDTITQKAMEGIYRVTDGTDLFGSQVALKWSFNSNLTDTTYYISIFCEKDITYYTGQGRKTGTDLLFNGYWRKMVNNQTGIARFTISDTNGSRQLLSKTPMISADSITMAGLWGSGENPPTNNIVLKYVRPLYHGKAFEIMAAHTGGQTIDHLPHAENSTDMIRYSSQLGATGIQMDLRITSDGVPILFRDDDFNQRLVQKSGLLGKVEDYTYVQINTFVKLIDGQSIPTLDNALDVAVNGTNLHFVWLDTRNVGSLATIQQLQSKYIQIAQTAGRDIQIVIGIPDQQRLSIFTTLPNYTASPSLCELTFADVAATNSVAWGTKWTSGIQSSEVSQIQGQGRKAFVWTIDDPNTVSEFISQGNFDGLLSDYPTIVAYYYYVRQ